jgi:hypothetical protein
MQTTAAPHQSVSLLTALSFNASWSLQAVDECSVGKNVDHVVFQRIVISESLEAVDECSVGKKMMTTLSFNTS